MKQRERRWLISSLALGIFLLVAQPAPASQWVNVSAEWCGGTCSEGHDGAACLCEYDKGQSPFSPSSWNHCVGVPCCDWETVYCRVGDPNCACQLQDGSNPERMRQWCFPSHPIVTCTAPYTAGSYSCSYDCTYETECQINYPTNNPNWIFINTASGEQCTGENETGFWSWASWKSFWTGADTCNLSEQSPWDDYPLENEICE